MPSSRQTIWVFMSLSPASCGWGTARRVSARCARALTAPGPSTPVALARQHELLGQRDARRRRRVGDDRYRLGARERDGELAAGVGGERERLGRRAGERAAHAGFDPGFLEVAQEILGFV